MGAINIYSIFILLFLHVYLIHCKPTSQRSLRFRDEVNEYNMRFNESFGEKSRNDNRIQNFAMAVHPDLNQIEPPVNQANCTNLTQLRAVWRLSMSVGWNARSCPDVSRIVLQALNQTLPCDPINSCVPGDKDIEVPARSDGYVVRGVCGSTVYRVAVLDSEGNQINGWIVTTQPEDPTPPKFTNVTLRDDNSVELSWSRLNCPDESRVNTSVEHWQKSNDRVHKTFPVGPGVKVFEVRDLSAWTDYLFGVRICDWNICTGSQPLFELRTNMATPSEPRNLTFTVTSTGVELGWEPPKEPNGPLSEYRITFKLTNPRRPSDATLVKDTTIESKYLSTSLIPWREYEATVVAVNHDEKNNEDLVGGGATLLVETPIEVPRKPSDVRITIKSSSEVEVHWTPTEPETGPTTYSVQLDEAITDMGEGCDREELLNFNEGVKRGQLDGWENNQMTFDDLKPSHCYRARVTSETKAGSTFSDYSNVHQIPL